MPALVLLALLQPIAPAVAAIADAWRMDERAPYAHMESETGASCVFVHAHDCALCSIATTPSDTGVNGAVPAPECGSYAAVPSARVVAHAGAVPRLASQRAPPAVRG